MFVQVKLFATLRELFPNLGIGESMQVEVPSGAKISDLIRKLELPPEEVKLVYVNGRLRDLDYTLSDGDEVGIFPPVGGG